MEYGEELNLILLIFSIFIFSGGDLHHKEGGWQDARPNWVEEMESWRLGRKHWEEQDTNSGESKYLIWKYLVQLISETGHKSPWPNIWFNGITLRSSIPSQKNLILIANLSYMILCWANLFSARRPIWAPWWWWYPWRSWNQIWFVHHWSLTCWMYNGELFSWG